MKLESTNYLREKCQGQGMGGGYWFDDVVIRRISIYFTWLLIMTPLSPNQITFIATLFGLAGAYLFSLGSSWSFFAGAICAQLFVILDACDGEVARYRGQASHTGRYIDLLAQLVVQPALFIGITFGVAEKMPHDYRLIFLLGYVALLGMAAYEVIMHFSKHFIVMMQAWWQAEKKEFVPAQVSDRPATGINKGTKRPKFFALTDGFLRFTGTTNIITLLAIIGFFYNSTVLYYGFLWFYAVAFWFDALLALLVQLKTGAVEKVAKNI